MLDPGPARKRRNEARDAFFAVSCRGTTFFAAKESASPRGRRDSVHVDIQAVYDDASQRVVHYTQRTCLQTESYSATQEEGPKACTRESNSRTCYT